MAGWGVVNLIALLRHDAGRVTRGGAALKQKISVRFGICFGMLLLVSNVLLTPAANAQVDAGGIRGTITDSSGALVSGAKVTLTNEGSGLSTEEITGGDGNYSFTPIKIGSFTLVVEATG